MWALMCSIYIGDYLSFCVLITKVFVLSHLAAYNMVNIFQCLSLTFMGPCILKIFQYVSNKMQRYTVYFIWKLLYMFWVVSPPIIRSANNFIYSIWYLSHCYCYLPLSWKSWNWFQCAVHTETSIASHSNIKYDFHIVFYYQRKRRP